MKFIFLSFALVFALPTFAQSTFINVKTGSQWVGIFDQPTDDNKKITDIAPGAHVVITGREGDFYSVKYKRHQGWVHKMNFTLTPEQLNQFNTMRSYNSAPMEDLEALYIYSALKYQLENDKLSEVERESLHRLLEKYQDLAYPE